MPKELIDGKDTSKGQYINFNNDEFILVFRDVDREAGETNLGHIFKAEDLTEEKRDTLHESSLGMQWRIIYSDYEKIMIMSACFENTQMLNKDA